MKLSRRPITRTDAITVTLLAAAGAVFGCIAGATIGGTPTALGLSFMGSVSGALGGVLFCFCRKPGDTRVSLERVAILCFVFALLMSAMAVLDHSNLLPGIVFALCGFILLAASRKKTAPNTTPDGIRQPADGAPKPSA